jgi:hypothetical protein
MTFADGRLRTAPPPTDSRKERLMRYYVVSPGGPGIEAHIVAEVVRDRFDQGEFRDSSYASALAGDESAVLLPEEVMSDAVGRQALLRWNTRDDGAFDAETGQILSEVPARGARSKGHLTLVSAGDAG